MRKQSLSCSPPFLTASLVLSIGFCAFLPMDAFAGPGGEVVEAIFKTRLGRILGILAAIILLPLIIGFYISMAKGVKQTLADINVLAETYPFFNWEGIEARARRTVEAIYGEWSSGQLKESSAYLTPEYLVSQQDILDMWAEEDKQNITELKSIGKIKPLRVLAQDWARPATVIVQVNMTVKDYMATRSTGKKLKGSKKFESLDKILTFVYENDEWRLSSIENDSENLNIVSEPNEISTVRTRSENPSTSGSKLAGAQASEDDPATEVKQPGVSETTDKDNS